MILLTIKAFRVYGWEETCTLHSERKWTQEAKVTGILDDAESDQGSVSNAVQHYLGMPPWSERIVFGDEHEDRNIHISQ